MSLGFLTESALVPSKAKSIKVDSNSLVDLQAVIYKKEQEQRQKGAGETSHATLRAKRGARATKSSESTKSNRGINKRKQKDDEDELLGEDERAKKKRSRQILIEKAKLYDDLASGRKAIHPSSTMDDSAAPLVNFAEKKLAACGAIHKDHEFVDGTHHPPPPSASAPLTIETKDEFGRTITVPFAAGKADPVVEEAQGGSTSSFVVSQWERTLKQQEKGFLHQVHEEAKLAKLTMADKAQRKQARLAKLQQALRTPPNTSDSSAAPPVDGIGSPEIRSTHAASREAEAFLSSLL
ncbi:hypothetical protein H310_07709 [Aphanomyces invadans]|uniref:Uncharacterized protein n=1 Tax=Aphanomyces invadans TaxID=157072 RepID=A0A024U383_9STRA|nr:hypothetical protein H310_07709 [Aphanomyces invadans]ETW00342.1 hypothetical protein H310_07709 [Aphanomyces invadans]|eukprot:XP_008871367.1 hypothetical protein H310_07709 [Aphanomyces invadans]